MITIDDFPDDEEIRKMPDDKLLESYKIWIIMNDGISLDRDQFATIPTVFGKIITRKTNDKRKEHRMKYKAYRDSLCHKIRVAQDEINKRPLDVKWWEDNNEDPLYNWYFQRMGKQDLISIIDDLNKKKGSIAKQLGINLESKVKLSGTLPELRRRVMDYIPKTKRKEYITRILSKIEDND